MPLNRALQKAEHYRNRATQLRALAEAATDGKSKTILENVAIGYERMAQDMDAIMGTVGVPRTTRKHQ